MSFFKDIFQHLSNRVLSGAAGSFALNIVNQALLLGITILLTRLLGVSNYGLYAVILSTMILLALPFSSGFATFTIRHVSKFLAQNRYDLFRGFLCGSALWAIGGSIVFYFLIIEVIHYFEIENAEQYETGAFLIFAIPFLLYTGAILRGMRHVLLGRFSEFFIQPVLFFAVLLCFFIYDVDDLSLKAVLVVFMFTYLIAACFSSAFLLAKIPAGLQKIKATFEIKTWIKSALPLMISVGLIVVNSNIDIVMVGAIEGDAEAGQYRVATRMAGLVLFFLFAANNAIGALISTKHAKGETQALQGLLTAISRLTMVCTVPLVAILMIWPSEVLAFFFGSPFIAGAVALMILTAANFFSVSMGQVGHVMAMTGQEKYTAYAAFMAMLVNVGLNLYLIPQYGINGAAVATATSIIIWNGMLAYWTVKKTGYRCSVLG